MPGSSLRVAVSYYLRTADSPTWTWRPLVNNFLFDFIAEYCISTTALTPLSIFDMHPRAQASSAVRSRRLFIQFLPNYDHYLAGMGFYRLLVSIVLLASCEFVVIDSSGP